MSIAVFFLLLHGVEASNKFWIAASSGNFNVDANWSLSSGGPPNTTAPGAGDVVFFDGNGLGNCTITAIANVQGINMGSGYSGTIAVASGITLTVGGNGFSQSAGTFNGGNSTIDVNGNYLLQGTGVFNSTTGTLFLGATFDHNTSTNPGGTFNHNNGTVTFDGSFGGISSELSGTIFNNLNFDHTGQRTVFSRIGGGPTLTVLGALALNDGQLFGNQIEARGSLTISPNFDGAPSGHATLVITNGTGPRTITFGTGIKLLKVVLNDPNVTIQTSGSGTLGWQSLTLQAGTINQGGVDFSFVPNGLGNYSQSGGTFNGSANSIAFQSEFNQSGGTFNGGSGNIDVDGNFALQGTGIFNSTTGTLFVGRAFDHDTLSVPGGTFNHNNGTVVFDGADNGGLNISAAGETFNNLTFTLPDAGQRNLSGGPFIALGALTLNNGTLFLGVLQPRGNLVIAGTFDGGNGTAVTFSGSNNQSFTNSGGANPTGAWTVNKSAGSVTLLSDLILGTSQSLNLTSGTLDMGASFSLTAGAITIGASGMLRNFGTGDLTVGSSLTNSGVFNFNGGGSGCGDAASIFIRSSVSTVARPWSGSGMFSVVNVDVKDQNAAAVAGTIVAFNSLNSGNNTNWTFALGCSIQINTQPNSQSVCPNVSVSFTVAALGTGLTFQWRKNGVNLTNGGNISGATTTMLTINPVGPFDQAAYDVVVTDTFGVTATSMAATLTVAGAVTTTADSGAGSLRQAILDVNSCPGLNTIAFNIPGAGVKTITPLSALPTITDPVIIDGTSQPGFAGSPLIELNGASAGAVNGLLITAGDSTVKGLVINRFLGMGIEINTNGGSTIRGCYIGTNAAGTADLGNFDGVRIINSNSNVIGGTTAAERNVISGNSSGIFIFNSSFNQVIGNFIGTDVTGTLDLGNSQNGVVIRTASNNVIGGATVAERNVISGNDTRGVLINFGATGTQVIGNLIGTDVTGMLNLGNSGAGVQIDRDLNNNTSNNAIGGTNLGEGNTIAFNGFGVLAAGAGGGTAVGNAVRGNSIFSNDNLGIDLPPGGIVNPNDAGDGDTGFNNLQNFPSLLSANATGTSITIQASLSSTPNTFFNIDFYSSPTADPTGFGEGKVFLGSRPAATQDTGEITFTATFNTAVTLGHFITATAIDLAGNTSEFSLAHVVSDAAACATLELVPPSASFNDAGGSGLINVIKAAGCAWTAVSNVSWITNVAPPSGSGNGAVTYTVASNASGCRSGTITVGGRTFTVTQSCPTAIELISFSAERYENGTFIEWKTGFEASNLGFNIYREESGKRSLINTQLVAGAALTAGSTLRAGQGYAWWDAGISDCGLRDADCRNAAYWLEDIDLNGQSKLHGPFYPKPVDGKPPARSRAAFLSEVGRKPDHQSSPLERRASLGTLSTSQLTQSADLASKPGVKIAVNAEGWYRVTQPELLAIGFDPAGDPRFLQLLAEGRQQHIIVSGEQDGRFDPEDFLEFYGTGIDSPFADSRVYWLRAGDQPGLRVAAGKFDGAPSNTHSFTATVERRDRSIHFAALRNGDQENFFGAVIASSPVDQHLAITNLEKAASGNARLDVALQGATLLEHRVRIDLNGEYAGEVSFFGQDEGIAKLIVPQKLLKEGINNVQLTPVGGDGDVSLVNYIRISYEHALTADNDALKLTAAGQRRITIDGFSSKAIRVFDITDDGSPQELSGEIDQQKSGYRVSFASPLEGERTILAIAVEPRGARLSLKQPSNVRNLNASLLIITTRELAPALPPLVALRESQGFSVGLVDIEHIYDEFSFGQKTPVALRTFMSLANSSWKKKPKYVLFAGDASFDPKNYLGFGDFDLIPAKLIDTDFMESATDDWFSDFDGDGISDVATGRFPARIVEELSAMVSKTIRYEQSGPSEEALLVADANEGFDFERASTDLRSLIPGNLRITQVNRGRVDAEMARNSLIEAIYRKQFLVNYVGHGSVNQWRGNLLTNEQAVGLRNEHFAMFVMMTCLNGYFNDPALDSLGESLMKAEGGSVAVWASSGMTMPGEQAVVNQELYRLLFNQDQRLTIGEAAMRARRATNSLDVRRTWILFGDPTTKLK